MLDQLLSWRRRAAPPLSNAAAPAPERAVTAAMEARVARWFAAEAPETVALAVESLRALARASPRFVDRAIPNPTPLAWLASALDRLERFPEPLPIPRDAPRLSWRYLLWTRMVCDHLEAAYDELRRRGIAARCPLTDLPDPFPPPREVRLPRPRPPALPAGLGALVAGTRLPDAGQRRLLEAHAEGLPWADSAAFWRRLGADATPTAEPTPAHPAAAPEPVPLDPSGPPVEPDPATVTPPRPARISAPGAASSEAGPHSPMPVEPFPSAPPVRPPADEFTALATRVRAALAQLVAGPGFNHQCGDLWFDGDAFWVVALPFAERIQAQPPTAELCNLNHRKRLYRQMAAQGLLFPHGSQPVWYRFILDPGRSRARYASLLKLPARLHPSPCPPYQGRILETAPELSS